MDIVFTEHAKERMKKRKISEEEVKEVIKYPEKTEKQEGLYYAKKNIQRANIEVVYTKDKYIKVITVYYI
ncbi:DUF4258 domain-containing protein [Candidatus Pacearchaeota archaeon]|nr:DUF4258 domain-containing protein [Candidatus Pacearchaeota archaeon]